MRTKKKETNKYSHTHTSHLMAGLNTFLREFTTNKILGKNNYRFVTLKYVELRFELFVEFHGKR